jgi:hypothetical protein
MYFSGILALDPSKATVIKKIKPTKMFGKLLNALTFGSKTKQEEHETFTAISILQQINMALRDCKVNNIIRLNVNDHDFYLDEEGKEDDLSEAMLHFETKIDDLESKMFEEINMVLEHRADSMNYIFDIQIKRKHKVGEYPIVIKTNGIMNDFKLNTGEDRAGLENRMSKIFQNQDDYDLYVKSKNLEFERTIGNIELSLRKFIQTSDIHKELSTKVIRPKEKVREVGDMHHNRYADPVYHGYHGYGDASFYSYMWASMMHSHNVYVHNVDMVDSTGTDVMSVGDEGFNAGENNAFNEDADFEAPESGDVDFHGGSEEFQNDIPADSFDGGGDSGGFEDTFSSGFDGDAGGDAGGCSSCSSCSSCGGCGGCS